MKKLVLLTAFAFLVSLPLHADVKIVLVDLNKVFENYYKTKQVQGRIQEEKSLAEKDLQDRNADLQKMGDALKDLQNQYNDKTLSDTARADKKDIFTKKLQDYRLLQQQIEQLIQTKNNQMQSEMLDNHKRIIDEISKAVNDYAVSKSFDLVIDRSAPSVNGAPVLLYASPAVLDITPEIITKLNSTQPPAGTTGVAPTTGISAPGTSSSVPAPASGL